MGYMSGVRMVAASVLMVAASSGVANAQSASSCKVVSHGNVTMFERMVAERLDAGWSVKGGLYKDDFGFAVLMCSR